MPHIHLRLLLGLLLGQLALLSGCSGSLDRAAVVAPGGLQIPFPSRDVAWLTESVLSGDEWYQAGSGAQFDPNGVRLEALADEFQYAVYRFNVGTPAPAPQSATVTAEPVLYDDSGDPAELWLGRANFATGRWEVSGPYSADVDRKVEQTLPLSSDYISPNSNIFIFAAAFNGINATINEVKLSLDVGAGNPLAVIYCDTPRLQKPFFFFLEGGGSLPSPGQTITNYEWDYDGDGVFSELGNEADHEGNVNGSLQAADPPGERVIGLRVTDSGGGQSTATTRVYVLGALVVPIDGAEGVGKYCSLAVIGGKPMVSYYDDNTDSLKFAYSSTPEGRDPLDWTAVTVVSGGEAGYGTSLREIDGRPAIAYYIKSTGDLGYAINSAADASGSWTTVTVDAAGDCGNHLSLALIDGKPAVAYQLAGDDDLRYAYSSTVDGAGVADWTALTVDSVSRIVRTCSLAEVNGKPAIAYYDFTAGFLRYAYSSEPDGSSGWTSIIPEETLFTGNQCSLLMVEGKPAIAYAWSGQSYLAYAYSNTVDGAAVEDWDTANLIDDTTGVAVSTSLALINGRPAVAHLFGAGSADTDVRYTFTGEVGGHDPQQWATRVVQTGMSQSGASFWTSLAQVGSGPAIAYYDSTTFGGLRIAFFNPADLPTP